MLWKLMLSLALVAGACSGGTRTCAAQDANQHAAPVKLLTMVDTAHVAVIRPGVYGTWIYAMATPTSWPSAAIYVLFDCKAQRVARLYHIVYRLRADSLGVEGPIEEDSGEWVKVSVPVTFNLVCQVGQAHEAEWGSQPAEPEAPKAKQPDMPPDWRSA